MCACLNIDHYVLFSQILYLAIAVIAVIFRLSLKGKQQQPSSLLFYSLCGVVALLLVLPVSRYTLSEDLIPWIIRFTFGEWKRVSVVPTCRVVNQKHCTLI